MEPNKITNNSQNLNNNEPIQEELEKEFCDRPYEEVEDGYIDDRGFYTTPNGSFWDEDQTYFNHLGFDRHGGSYDKYGIYLPGTGYDEKTGLYKDQKEFFSCSENIEENKIENSISKLRAQEKKDEKIMKKYEELVEESEDEDDKSNITFDDEDIKEAYNDVMEIENKEKYSMNIKLPKHNENENINTNINLNYNINA